MKISPFCLHLFFAMDVLQRVVFQLVAVKVKVKDGVAFTLNRLIYSLLWGKVKGEGKNGKFADCAGAYIRVGACLARRMEWEFVRGREVLRETREEVAKSGDVLRESRLVFFERSGEGMRTYLSCLLVLGLFCDTLMCFVLLFLFCHDVLLLFVLGFLISTHPFSF